VEQVVMLTKSFSVGFLFVCLFFCCFFNLHSSSCWDRCALSVSLRCENWQ
jgi:hypothetical protein